VNAMLWSPDGKHLVTYHDWDQSIKVWAIDTGQELMRLSLPENPGWRNGDVPWTWSPNGTRLALRTFSGNPPDGPVSVIQVWDVVAGRQERVFPAGATGTAAGPPTPNSDRTRLAFRTFFGSTLT